MGRRPGDAGRSGPGGASPPFGIDLVPPDWGPQCRSPIADLALTRRGPDQISFRAPTNFLLLLLTPQTARRTRLGSSRYLEFDAPVGSAEIIPCGADFSAQWQVPKENILVSLEQSALLDLALREFDAGHVELRPVPAGRCDREALQIARLLGTEIQREHRGALYIEALTTAFAIHFLRRYSSLGSMPQQTRVLGGLTPRAMREVEEFIEANLAHDISLADLAGRVGLSYSHFLRAFRQSFGEPPHRFLMNMRTRRAEMLIRTSDKPLKQIAQETGFASQSHMTTVMGRLLHIRPGELRGLRRQR